MEVVIGGKKYHVGREWHTYSDESDAKERLKEFREDGYDAILFKVGGQVSGIRQRDFSTFFTITCHWRAEYGSC